MSVGSRTEITVTEEEFDEATQTLRIVVTRTTTKRSANDMMRNHEGKVTEARFVHLSLQIPFWNESEEMVGWDLAATEPIPMVYKPEF